MAIAGGSYRALWLVAAIALTGATGALHGRAAKRGAKAAPPARAAKPLDGVVGEVDDALARAWKKAGVAPTAEVDWLTATRRLSLALTGTIPSLEELRALEKLPRSKRAGVHLERLLRDRRFADHFAERLARAFVGTDNGPFLVFRRRRFVYWLSDALHEGRPYDAIVHDLVAGQGLWTDHPGTNFITAQERDPVRLTAVTSRALLGVRMDCAQCHDHPFSHWKQSDFQGLAGFYAGVTQTITGIGDSEGDFKPGGRMMMMASDTPAARPALPFARGLRTKTGTRREQLARWITSPDNRHFGRAIANRVWTLMMGQSMHRGGVDDIESTARVEGVIAALGRDFQNHGHDLRRLIRAIASSDAFQRVSGVDDTKTGRRQRDVFAAFPATQLRADQIAGALVQLSSIKTVDADSHVVWRLVRFGNTKDFVKRYGDAGKEELAPRAGTIAQRLVMMNGRIVRERTEANPLTSAGRIAMLAKDDVARVDLAFAVALTREPTDAERATFVGWLAEAGDETRKRRRNKDRGEALADVLWTLINTTEFSWNR